MGRISAAGRSIKMQTGVCPLPDDWQTNKADLFDESLYCGQDCASHVLLKVLTDAQRSRAGHPFCQVSICNVIFLLVRMTT